MNNYALTHAENEAEKSIHLYSSKKMSSFCRITGKAKDMPKPNFFPIIPPISPADAR